MDKILKFWNIIKPVVRYLILVYTGLQLLIYHNNCRINFILLFILEILLIIFTFIYMHNKTRKKTDKKFLVISMLVFMFMCTMGSTDITYYFVLMDDIFEIPEFKLRMKFILFHFCVFLLFNVLTFSNKSITHTIHDVIVTTLFYMLVLFIFSLVHNCKYERDKLKILNSNLIEYSFKERDYLLSQERTRISQELHDSIGHSLMALSMNIRYLKALEDKEKIQNEINEIDNLVKESIETLRSTVYNLKELDEDLNIKEEIKELTKKFNELNLVKINFDCSNDINFSSNNIKNVLLSTIKEGITNSLKHGNPSTINISIRLINDNFELILSDNGEGCKFINKSDGLNGITERIKKFSGQVAFTSSINKGFTIKALIPGGFLND